MENRLDPSACCRSADKTSSVNSLLNLTLGRRCATCKPERILRSRLAVAEQFDFFGDVLLLRNSSWRLLVAGLIFGCLSIPRSVADVGVVLNESLDTSIARITGSGHTAVYLSRICPESPVKLRLCHADEHGSVISNYISLGEDQPYEWNIAPLNVY